MVHGSDVETEAFGSVAEGAEVSEEESDGRKESCE